MSKILSSVLDKISENNNDYRKELKKLNTSIEEKSTTFVGNIVTASNYVIDFTNAVELSKNTLVSPIIKSLESYVIKDLRSVETVNEQFVEKINDKIENSDIKSLEEKRDFIDSLNTLLNEKYLEIVKIKRVPYIKEDGTNSDVESSITEFINTVAGNNVENTKKEELVNSYKNDLYGVIKSSLNRISNLYLNNFVDGVSSSLNQAIDYDDRKEEVEVKEKEEYKPFIPNIAPINQVSDSNIEKEVKAPAIDEIKKVEETIQNVQKPLIIINEDTLPKLAEFVPPVLPSIKKKEEAKENKEEVVSAKKSYDVEEILKIAKSPVVADIPALKEEEKEETRVYDSVKPISIENDVKDDVTFDEKQIVEEMIRRLSSRLKEIDSRETKCKEEEEAVSEDEAFVNDLIDSADKKKVELDEFEKSLDAKEAELKEKEKELKSKIDSIMPFANAVLENDK